MAWGRTRGRAPYTTTVRRNHALALLLLALLMVAPCPAAAGERGWLDFLKEALDGAAQAEGGKAWDAAEAEVKGFPTPSNSDLTLEEHGRAIELVRVTIDAFSRERRLTQGKIPRAMDSCYAAYHRSKGKLGRDFDTFTERAKELRALWVIHDRHTALAPRLATALRSMILQADDPGAWAQKLEANWARSVHSDDQRLWVALLEGGPEPDVAGLAAAVGDTRLAGWVRALALEAWARHAPQDALGQARTLLDPSPEAWHLSDAALRIVAAHGSAADADLLDPLASSGAGWLGVDARALRARLRGVAAPDEVGVFGIPIGNASVLFLIDGKEGMGASLAAATQEIADAIDALPETARVAVWLAARGIDPLVGVPTLLTPPERLRIRRLLEKQTPKGDDLPDFFVALQPLLHDQRESVAPPRIDTVVILTGSVLYQDEDLIDRYARWARRAGLRVHCVHLGRRSLGKDEYSRLAEATGGRLVLRPPAGD